MQKKSCDRLLHHATVLTPQMEAVSSMSIAIADGKILEVLKSSDALRIYDAAEVVDSHHLLWMPGLTDGHMHTGQQLLRGKVLDALPMIWTRIMLPFESTLTSGQMRLSAQLAALEMIRSGTSSFVDAGSYHMNAAASVYAQSGLRGALSRSTMDDEKLPASIAQNTDQALASSDEFYGEWNGAGNLKVYYALRSLISCSPQLITTVFGRAREQGAYVQAHMNEYSGEINYHLERYQLRPFEYLESLGVLDVPLVAAHCLMLSPKEMDLMQQYTVKVVHCPFSNCGKGAPETPALLKRGIPAGIGTDGTAHGGMSLWNEFKVFRSVMNVTHGIRIGDPVIMPADTILSMATTGGAFLLGEAGQLGAVQAGYSADLISINLDQPHLTPTGNLIHTLVESVNAGDVTDMMVNGAWIMRNRQVLTLDEEKIMYEAKQYGGTSCS